MVSDESRIKFETAVAKTKKRIADRKSARNKRSNSNENKEYLTIKNNKVVVVNQAGDVVRTTLRPNELSQSRELIKSYNTSIRTSDRDQTQMRSLLKKINAGTATNRDYVNYQNLSTKYGGDPEDVKKAISVAEKNKAKKSVSRTNDFFSPERSFAQNNPDMKVKDSQTVTRFYDNKNNIIGVEGGAIGQRSIFAPRDSFFTESKIKDLELMSSARMIMQKETPKSGVETFLSSSFNKAQELTGFNSGSFNEIQRAFKEPFVNAKPFVDKALRTFNIKSDDPFNRETSAFKLVDKADTFISEKLLLVPKDFHTAKRLATLDEFKGSDNFMRFAGSGDVIIPLHQGVSKLSSSAKGFSRGLLQNTYEDWDKKGNDKLDKLLMPFAPFADSPTANLRNIGNVALTGASGLVSHAGLDLAYIAAKKPITTTATIGGILVANAALPGTAGVAGTAFSIKDWISRPTASDKALAFGGDVAISAISWGAPRAIEASITRLDPSFSKVTSDSFGRKKVSELKTVGGDVIEVDIVPQGYKAGKLDIDIKGVLKDYKGDIPYKTGDLFLPRANSLKQQQILNIFKGDKDIAISGSFSQQVLLRKEFNRGFDDLDIGSKNPKLTTEKILSNIDDVGVRTQPTALTIFDTKSGKDLVDIVPLKISEGGFATKYPFIQVEGVNLIDARARLAGKSQALSQGIKIDKTTGDINFLTGGKAELDFSSQSVKGGFGSSFAEQSKFVGQKGNIITAQVDLFPKKLFGKFKDDILIHKPNLKANDLEGSFFASSWDFVTKNPQLRGSRLGTSSAASFDDLFSGDVQFGRGRPQSILFEQHKVADIPENLQGLWLDAKKGGEGSSAYNKFFTEYKDFQMTPTGEFKAYGFKGGEAELTLSPFETIRGKGKIGVTLVDNQKVTFIQAEVVKASPELASLQIKELDNTLSRNDVFKLETLRDVESKGLSSYKDSRPFIDPFDYAGSFDRGSSFSAYPTHTLSSSSRGSSSLSPLGFSSKGVSSQNIGFSSFPQSSSFPKSSLLTSSSSRGSISKNSPSLISSPASVLSSSSSLGFSSSPLGSSGVMSSPSPRASTPFSFISPTPTIFNFKPKTGRGTKSINVFRGFSQRTAYNPTITSLTFGLEGSPSKFGVKTGLSLRPVKKLKNSFEVRL